MANSGEVHSVPKDLAAADLEAMLGELLQRYTDDSFQAALQKAYAACAQQGLGLQAALGPLVLQVQRPVLEKYGLPPNAKGVDLMKHAVQRRICEGADRVEELANEARKALGIEQLPDRHRSAEEQLAKSADDTAKRFACDKLQVQLRQQCQQLLDQGVAKKSLPSASAEFLQELLDPGSGETSVQSVLCMIRMAQLGIHVDLLRGRDLPTEVRVFEEVPSADDFFREVVMPSRPAVIRKALVESRFSPLRKLPDFTFLRDRCSHRRVLVKSLGFKDEDGRPQFMTDPELKLPFAAYLEAVEAYEEDRTPMPFYLGKVPLRAELPELADEVEEAATNPRREFGGCFGELLPEGVFTYFGAGRNSTSVHYDCHENLMACLCGTKRLWLYPPGDARYVYPISKDRAAGIDFSRSSILPFRRYNDLSPENQARYPLLPQASPLEVMVFPGDVLYLPSCWWHCVEGSEERNIILNWWFCMHPEKKAAAWCGETLVKQTCDKGQGYG